MNWANHNARILAVLRKMEEATRREPKSPAEEAIIQAIYGICEVICEKKGGSDE